MEQIIRMPIAWFKPFANNPKTHPPDQVVAIRAAMNEFGWTIPILADPDGEIIAGHGRALAAALEPAFSEAPTIIARGWSEAQKRAYRIADNKLSERGVWNEDALRVEIAALQTASFDLSVAGFTVPDLGALGIVGFTQPELNAKAEETPPLPAKPIVKSGELWLLGDHRLLVGDCTDKAAVSRAVGEFRPNLMVTDPPYGVEYDANWRNEADRANGKAYGARAIGKVSGDTSADWRLAWALFEGDIAYCWHAGRHARTVQESLESVGFAMRSQIIWAKDRLIISRGDYHWQHEPCWYAVRKGKKGNWHGGRSQTTLWSITHAKSETGHSTQKPIECMRRPIINNSKKGDWIYDPFLGSGTTLVSCEMESRRCIGIEIDPAYAQLTIERWEKFTSHVATRADGATLESLAKKRKK